MRTKYYVIIFALALLLIPASFSTVSDGEVDDGKMVLIDMGNGETYWISADASQPTAMGVIKSALDKLELTYEQSGSTFTINGINSTVVSGSGGSVSSLWNYYVWTGSQWLKTALDVSTVYSGSSIALGFYSSYGIPIETPDYQSSWVMTRGDAVQSASQTAIRSSEDAVKAFEKSYGDKNMVCGSPLVAGDKVFVVAGGSTDGTGPALYAYDRFSFEELWHFEYPEGAGYETATGAIAGGYYFLPATEGHLYRIPLSGPGDGNADVRSLEIPLTRDHPLLGNSYASGPSSLSFDSGVLYFGSSNGYVYAVDPGFGPAYNMKVLWKTAVGGSIYYMNAMVSGNQIYVGALDGTLYVINKTNGNLLTSETVYTITDSRGNTTGGVNVPVVVGDSIFVPFDDGRGMNNLNGGIAIYKFDAVTNTLTQTSKTMDTGLTGSFILPVINDGFKGVYFTAINAPLGRMDLNGDFVVLNEQFGTVKAGLVLVNGDTVILTDYNRGQYIYTLDLDGNIKGKFQQPEAVDDYVMAAPTVIDNYIYSGTDGGFYSIEGELVPEPAQESSGISWWIVALLILVVLIVAFVVYSFHIRKTKNMSGSSYLKQRLGQITGTNDSRLSKTKQNKRKLAVVLIIGTIVSFVMFLMCLSFGPYNIPMGEALSSLVSAIGKGGNNLTDQEVLVYHSRLPRAIAAVGVGMGLAIAGSIYQAIIRNPLVDPYIMGVSSGAGTLAVAAITANFTFFGLLAGTNFAMPIMAIVGGLFAFGVTMLLAEKAGGSSTNYVLAGVVVGLAFSSLMTVLMTTANSDKLHSAINWLYGSFSSIGWDTVWLVFFPALFLSFIPLLWAKEMNLVLLGEDQAQQMGLNVKRFNRWMLILASILTSICVAFVGIIGFVGLVVPHICRMILGGDHRLVLPASIVVGAALMLFADLVARMIWIPIELPVGAITTIIGVPVFAYLLIKRGRMYDG
ncbi:MAG: iron chelate uptake ABC transporter family permease subunit [Candidatus Methanoplasma sp.]|jgi:iron complex transport system permease protein|nr:iron chelate uptake ABC transporter family permease subunit [Candidatus Methanoplasma sp.]